MPRNTREWSKRKLLEACNTLDWTATHLIAVYNVYNPTHPEIGTPLEYILNALTACQDKIREIEKSY